MTTTIARSIAKFFLPQRARRWYLRREFARSLPECARSEDLADRQDQSVDDPGIQPSIDASLHWLARAQDCSTSQDGGVARHFSLITGWAESYPETTGYIIPTILDCSRANGRTALVERGQRMLDWCLSIQRADGAFHGGTVSATPQVPTTFNTGQILLGLAAGAAFFQQEKYRRAMNDAATWLCNTQDTDGCWRRFPSPFTHPGEKTYETHVAWGLFEAARVSRNPIYGQAGLKQVRWALTKQNENGWFRDCCLSDSDRPLTHTIGYVLRGVLEACRYSGETEFLDGAHRTGSALLDCLSVDGRIPGRLDSNWRSAASWICLTGTVQIALCWFILYELTGEKQFLAAARKANSFVRRVVKTKGDPDFVGGVKGSFPISGDYGSYEYLNWAAKFHIDSNRHEKRLIS